jgi:hypothetical protein
MNPYLDTKEIKEAFMKCHLEESYAFLEEDLEKLADAFVMAAMPCIVRTERKSCISFVRTLNTFVAEKLEEVRGPL